MYADFDAWRGGLYRCGKSEESLFRRLAKHLIIILIVSPCLQSTAISQEDVNLSDNMCGPNSLSLILAYLSGDLSKDFMELGPDPGKHPFSLAELEDLARQPGYRTLLLHWEAKEAASFDCPALLHVRSARAGGTPDHFIACFGSINKGICIADFPRSPRVLPYEDLYRIWDGDVLYVDRRDSWALDRLRFDAYGYRDGVRISLLVVFGAASLYVVARRASKSSRSSKTA